MDAFIGFIVGICLCVWGFMQVEEKRVQRGWFEHEGKYYQYIEVDPPYKKVDLIDGTPMGEQG
jgi:hypothetical protein